MASISPKSNTLKGYTKGKPRRFISGHNGVKPRPNLSGASPFKIDGQYCRLIPLTRGQFSIVDAEDYAWLSLFNWSATASSNKRYFYATRNDGNRKIFPMHQNLIGKRDGLEPDHINGNSLDNRKSNLRHVTHAQNIQNKKSMEKSTSRYKGVCLRNGKWYSQIYSCGRKIAIGFFDSEVVAAHAYDEFAKRLHGEFGRLNFPEKAAVAHA